MSMKRFAKGALRIANELARHTRLFPRVFQPLVPQITAVVKNLPRAPPRVPRNFIFRFGQNLLRHHRLFSRPFVSIPHYRHLIRSNSRFQNFNHFVKQAKQVGVVERIRDVFATKERYNPALRQDELPERIDAYDIGDFIAKGGNGAVYSLKLRDRQMNLKRASGFTVDPGLAFLPSTSSGVNDLNRDDEFKKYPLALKLMFNYDHELPGEEYLWREMGAELVPLPGSEKKLMGKFGRFALPSSHPNIVKVHTAFVDTMPILADAHIRYPEAIPPLDVDPKTLFVVMKRYRMNLHEYLQLPVSLDVHRGTVMLAQLLEGVTFLHKNCVAQRDMKSDNVLLEFDHYDEIPLLVISDFGCALATSSWKVHYKDDYVDLGGNVATRAPEVITARAGNSSYIDFSMADTWATGGLAYEIYTRRNPFYHRLKSATYGEEELPDLPEPVTFTVKKVVRDLLKRDPKQRVLPSVAANAVVLSLFRFGSNIEQFFSENLFHFEASSLDNMMSRTLRKLSEKAEKSLDDVLMMVTVETIFGRFHQEMSRAEAQVRATFLSRIERSEIWTTIDYFLEPQNLKIGLDLNTNFLKAGIEPTTCPSTENSRVTVK
ncbi:unnamed protein product, partial [Mesorhabditis belari]|uniref:non-specific serine/threonine protein kinase n=1 Tax=Mesorhabditis belari TaxID=2138241 RepID=A0AAF3F054_9BILA